jgi:flagellar basal-body rod modification protein FlgD
VVSSTFASETENPVDPISALTATTPDPLVESTNASQSLGQEAFLQLMVAQLRYQDPMSPADSASFLAQTAQFTMVEKLEQIAADMASMSRNDELATIGTLVGSNVRYVDETGDFAETIVTAGRTSEDGIVFVTPDRDIHIDDIVAIVAPPTN